MSKYRRLSEMGINNPHEIEKFAIYTVGHTDVLQITYDRKKGSLLPVSRVANSDRACLSPRQKERIESRYLPFHSVHSTGKFPT